MNSDKKLYLYSGLAVVGAIVAYALITNKKSTSSKSSEGDVNNDPETTNAVTTTGDVIDIEQAEVPASLVEVLKTTSAKATTALINKSIYTKLDNVKVRYNNYVNNGFISNIASTITNKGTLLGNVVQVIDDKGKLKNTNGIVYKWFKIKPSQIAIDDMNRNKSFLTHTFSANLPIDFYVREDAIKLEK